VPTAKSRAAEIAPRKAPSPATVRSPHRSAAAATSAIRGSRSRTAAPEPPPRPAAGPAAGVGLAHLQIAECAYYRAEARGFAPGRELDDWLEAERSLLAGQQAPRAASRNTQGTRRAAGRSRVGGADERA